MPRYVSTLRAVYDAQDDVEAMLIADKIAENGAQDLDDEDDEASLEVTQVISNSLELTPDELISRLRVARNLLIKTRIRQCYTLAKELDEVIFALVNREEPGFTMRSYNHGDFLDLVESILVKGASPNV